MAYKTQLPQETVDKILDLYCNKQYGQQKVSKLTGVGIRIVRRTLLENNVHIRSFAEAAKTSAKYRRKYEVNDNYFDTQKPNMAYILGFLAADGSVSKSSNQIKIGLSAVDTDFLETIRQEIGVKNPILTYTTNNGFEVSELRFTSQKIKQELATYNIVPRKTYSFEFPQKLEKQYYKDFIRGYFDGDGSISTAGSAAIRFQICSNRPGVLSKIIEYFEECGVSRVSILKQPRGDNTLYYFQYSTLPTKKIFDILYYPGCLCLPRKYKKYKSLL